MNYLTKPFSMKELSCRVTALAAACQPTTLDPLASARPIAIKGLRWIPHSGAASTHGARRSA